MSIASLTVDLTASTARFEADIGRATQIATRESERLERAKQTLLKQLDRESESVGRSRGEVLALKLAYAGLGAEAEKYLAAVSRSGKAVATTSLDGQSEAVAALAAREEAANARRSASQLELVRSIASVSTAYQEQQRALAQAVAGGTLTPEAYREQLAAAAAVRDAGIKTARQRAAEAEAALEVAAVEERAAERRRVAAQRIVDGQNGLTATYRTQLQALRDLRDAGAISPQQFRQAGADLVAQQPAVQQRRRAAQEAEAEASARVAAAQRATAAEQAATAAFVAGVQRQAEAIGKSRSELLALEAARRGVTTELAPFIARIAQSEQSLKGLRGGAKLTAFEVQQLAFQVNDFAVQLASGQNPLVAFVQQGSQLSGTFGGAGGALRAVASLITPFRVAVGGATTVLGGFAFAAYEGAQQSKAFADAITLTGNFAGLTEGRFNSLTRTVAASGQVLVSAAREYGLALAATGQVSQKNFDAATEAAARFGAATGQSAKDVAQQFASLGEDVTAGATKLNQTYNFLTAAQFRQIREFQEQGRTTEALAIVYDSLNQRLRALEPNLGILDRTLRTVKGAWAEFWDAAFDIGRAETIDQKLEKARKAALRVRDVGSERVSQTQLDPERRARLSTNRATDIENADENVRLLQRAKAAQEAAAAAAAEAAADQKRAVSADAFVQGYLKRAKSVEALSKALDEARRRFADLEKVGQPVSADQQKAILEQIRAEFADKGATREVEQARRAYEELLRSITERRSAAELELATTERLSDAQRFAVDTVVKLAAGEQKLSDSQKRAVVAQLEGFLAAAQAVEVRKQLTEAEQRYAQSVERAGEVLARQQSSIAEQNAALIEQIETLGLTADAVERLRIKRLEESLAAREAAIAIERASGAALDPNAEREDAVTAALRRQIELRRELLALQQREAQQQDLRQAAADSAATLARGAADAVLQFGSLRDVVRGVVTDLARITVRTAVEAPLQRQLEGLIGKGLGVDTSGQTAAIAAQTTALTTNTGAMVALTTAANAAATALASVAGSSAGSGLASAFSTYFAGNDFLENPFAAVALDTGTNYVPYDGMKATLHKGEAVVPAKYNPAAGGRGAGNVSVTVENYSGGQARVEESTSADGSRQMRVIVEAAVAEVDRRLMSGGSTYSALRQRFGLSPTLARRG